LYLKHGSEQRSFLVRSKSKSILIFGITLKQTTVDTWNFDW